MQRASGAISSFLEMQHSAFKCHTNVTLMQHLTACVQD